MSQPIKWLYITLKRSFAGAKETQVDTLKALGLVHRHQTVQKPNNEAIRGAVNKVRIANCNCGRRIEALIQTNLSDLINSFKARRSLRSFVTFQPAHSLRWGLAGEAHGDSGNGRGICATASGRSCSENAETAYQSCPPPSAAVTLSFSGFLVLYFHSYAYVHTLHCSIIHFLLTVLLELRLSLKLPQHSSYLVVGELPL
jgi:ribosomal protein L30